jgi:hypothetical protein
MPDTPYVPLELFKNPMSAFIASWYERDLPPPPDQHLYELKEGFIPDGVLPGWLGLEGAGGLKPCLRAWKPCGL